MNTQRITVRLPGYLYENLCLKVPQRQVSRFVSRAIEEQLLETNREPVTEFLALRDQLPKFKPHQIATAINCRR